MKNDEANRRHLRINGQDIEQLCSLFRLLSDQTRLNILMLLAEGECHVSALCDQLRLPQPTVSHHLGLLRVNNVVDNRRAGKKVFYGLNSSTDHSDMALVIDAQNFEIRITPKS